MNEVLGPANAGRAHQYGMPNNMAWMNRQCINGAGRGSADAARAEALPRTPGGAEGRTDGPCGGGSIHYLSTEMNRHPSTHPVARRQASEPGQPARRTPTEQAALKLWVVLSRAQAAIARHAEADVARHGLTITEFAILEALHHKGPLLLGELQQKILVSSGGVTYLVDRLVEKGFVERRACPADRRARYAALTPAGNRLLARIFPEHAKHIVRALSGLGTAERAQATELLRTLGTTAAKLPVSGES
jgi:MarR family transcriptional regulator, 2-MHQ and catechol-resistance regulon repressor